MLGVFPFSFERQDKNSRIEIGVSIEVAFLHGIILRFMSTDSLHCLNNNGKLWSSDSFDQNLAKALAISVLLVNIDCGLDGLLMQCIRY